jgi:flagellar basal-body rod protein FlgF
LPNGPVEARNPRALENAMSLDGITNTARSLSFYMRLSEVTANNVANVNTDAFKADRLTAARVPGSNAPVPVGATDLRTGAIRDTGRPLDVALEGDGFLVVGTAGGERLFRGGSLRLDASARLVDTHGDPVLGETGPLALNGGTIEVAADGSVSVDGVFVDRLRRVAVDDPLALRKEGAGRFVPTAAAPRPVGDAGARVRQGAIEDPNVDPVLAMVDMVSVQRAFAANVQALRALDAVLGTVTGEVGKV